MIRKLVQIQLSDIVIPTTIITETSEIHLSFISESLKTQSELFFVTVIQQDNKYTLVDRYDVYLAAIKSKIKEISAVIISSKLDCTKTHFQITVKSVMNPVKIINSMKPYVEEYGLDETIKKLHLTSDFTQMYKLGLDQKILDDLDYMISSLCNSGVRTAVPLTLFTFISQIEKKQQSTFIKSLGNMVDQSDRHFRWPHNTFLRKLEMGNDTDVKKIPEKKLHISELEFNCQKCDTLYVVHDGIVNKKDESEDMVIHHKNDSTPRILIPSELVEHLGVTQKKPPKIISSADIDVKEIASYLSGRNYIILVGGNQG